MSLHIGNLSPRIRKDELERVFQRFGRCTVQLKDGYGFAVYEIRADAEKALRTLRGKKICGEPIYLSWSNKQPRALQRFERGSKSYQMQHGRTTSRRGGHIVCNFRSSSRQNYKISEELSDGQEHHQQRNVEPDMLDNGRWGEQAGDLKLGNGATFDRYEPDCGEVHQMTSRSGSVIRETRIGKDYRDDKVRTTPQTCFECGREGHKIRDCPGEDNLSGRNVDYRSRKRDDLEGPESKSRERVHSTRKHAASLREHGVGKESYRDERQGFGRKRRRGKGYGTLEKHHDKEARKSVEFASGSGSRSSSSRSRPLRSVRSNRSRSGSLKPTSMSGSMSWSRSRSSSPTSLSLSISLDQPVPSPSNKAVGNLNALSDNATSYKSKEAPLQEKQLLQTDITENNQSNPGKAEIDLNCLFDNTIDANSKEAVVEFENEQKNDAPPGTSQDKINMNDEEISTKNERESKDLENDVAMEVGPMSEPTKMPHSKDPPDSRVANDLSISPEELVKILKHYGFEYREETNPHFQVDEHFGSARLWPWEIIYYRRLKKGPVSTENYARRVVQNREFGITDKYIRSSSGWEELAHDHGSP